MSKISIAEFLADQAGGLKDSSGEFTLNSAKALEKLGRHQLADPALWAVKLAQSGVALEASRLAFKLDYSRTTVTFFGTPELDASELARMLLSGELPAEGWKRHLVVGLRAFYGQNPLRLSWSDSGGRRVVWEGEQVEVVPCASLAEGATLVVVAELHPFPRSIFRLNYALRQTMAEHQALSDRLQLCHIPITLDGRLISQQFPPYPRPAVSKFTQAALRRRHVALTLAQGHLPLAMPEVSSSKMDLRASSVPAPRLNPPLRVGAVMVLRPPVPESRCFFVKDGALLDPVMLDFYNTHWKLDLYLDADDLGTDLSEFKPLHPQVDFRAIKAELTRWSQEKGPGFLSSVERSELPYAIKHLNLVP